MSGDSIDWKMIDLERRLMAAQCVDGRPGLSESEMRLAFGAVPEAQRLPTLYSLKFGDATGARSDLPSQFAYAERNLEAAVRQIVRSSRIPGLARAEARGLGRVEVSRRPLSVPDMFFLGAYSVASSRPVAPADLLKLRVHLLKSFWKNGVRFAPSEISVSSARAGTALNPRSEIAVVFPVRNCSGGLPAPSKARRR